MMKKLILFSSVFLTLSSLKSEQPSIEEIELTLTQRMHCLENPEIYNLDIIQSIWLDGYVTGVHYCIHGKPDVKDGPK